MDSRPRYLNWVQASLDGAYVVLYALARCRYQRPALEARRKTGAAWWGTRRGQGIPRASPWTYKDATSG